MTALKGTIEESGIAEVFHLIGLQAMTGVLHLRGKGEKVQVSFLDGNVVRVEHDQRARQDRLGRMLVAAELIREAQLDEAIEEQQRTSGRLGDILLDRGVIGGARLREMIQLQTTETLYRLFAWKSGAFEFEQGPVAEDREQVITPLRGESVSREGLRMVEEWPSIWKTISSHGTTFLPHEGVVEDPAAEDHEPLGLNERRVLALVLPGRTVQKIIDLSRLGEFETCIALRNLVIGGHLRPAEVSAGGSSPSRLVDHASAFGVRLLLTAVLFASAAGLVGLRSADPARAPGFVPTGEVDSASERLLTGPQLSRIRGALQIYRAEQGEYPATLDALVREGLLRDDDLRHPWTEPYYYQREPGPAGFVLRPPFR